jgi:hypothetical protein
MYVRSDACYASNFTMAMKSNGKKRLCNDLRRINESFDLFMIPLTTLPEVFDTLAGSKCYSTIDMCAAFSQIPQPNGYLSI